MSIESAMKIAHGVAREKWRRMGRRSHGVVDLDDLVQAAWVGVLKAWSRHGAACHPGTLRSFVYNEVKRASNADRLLSGRQVRQGAWRGDSSRIDVRMVDVPSTECVEPDDGCSARRAWARAVITALPTDLQRKCMFMRYGDPPMQLDEIAAAIGSNRRAVWKAINRGLANLRKSCARETSVPTSVPASREQRAARAPVSRKSCDWRMFCKNILRGQ